MTIKLAESFNYAELTTQQKELTINATIEIKNRHQLIWENIITIGERLFLVKQTLNHGQFLDWITKEFQWSSRYARNFMTIYTELKSVNNHNFSHLSMRALSQLAYSLKDTTSDKEKSALLDKIEAQTNIKGSLTESEIKKIRDEISAEYQSQQTQLNIELNDLKYKLTSQQQQTQELSKFKQLYEETYQEKRTLEQQKEQLDHQLETIKINMEKEKKEAVKDYVSQFSQDLEFKKQKLEKDSQRLEAEIKARESNLISIKNKVDYARNYEKRHQTLTNLLSNFQNFTGQLSENQKDLIPTPAPEMLSEYQALICQLKLWTNILEKAIAPFTQSQTITITNSDEIKEGSLVTTDLIGTLYEVINIKENGQISVQTLEHPTQSFIGKRVTFSLEELILV